MNKNLDIIKMILEKLGEMGNNHVIGFGAVQPHYAKSTREILARGGRGPFHCSRTHEGDCERLGKLRQHAHSYD